MSPKDSPNTPAPLQPESPAESTGSNLPKAYDPSIIEQRWAEYWVREHLFDVATPNPGAPFMARSDMGGGSDVSNAFTILLPPPNVTGRLHMGHMLNQTEMDILTRWHRMRGETALWVPGTDHAGIATQMMVERQLTEEGTSRKALGREAFEARVWQWKCQYGSAITEQMKRLGASVDWHREYFTMDSRLSVAVKEAFVRLWEQGLIYRGAYIVNWDPQLQTAVSDLEVENEERAGHLYHIRYPLADGTGSIVVATTRPETMLGDTAVAVNPSDERYQDVIGKLVTLPLSAAAGHPDREIPILADDWANPEFGTGAVKVTPAHDPNDFAIGQRHSLPQLNIFDETAHINLPGSPYHGLDRFAARKRIVADLESAGLLVAVKDHTLTLPISQRTGAVIEPRLSMQWFLAVHKEPKSPGAPSMARSDMGGKEESPAVQRQSIAETSIAAVRDGHIRFTPENYVKIYNQWMTNIHDWCISRQLWWGHRIPAWHCGKCGGITVSRTTPTACDPCGSPDITQSTDVLDTWFSSGLLPFTVFGWPAGLSTENGERSTVNALTPDLAAFYPTTLLVTGFDILFFWVARMIMLGCHFMLDVPMPDGSPRPLAEAVPFKEVYIHGLVRDANREKMSKTKGNVINPIDVIKRFGTDAVRFTLASMASPGTDIAFSEARTEGYRAFANKIWNAARFLFMNLDRARETGYKITLDNAAILNELPDETPLETRWIFARLSTVSAEVERALNDYRFDEAANAIYQFFWGEFCDWYLELVKLRLNFDLPAPSSGSPQDPSIRSPQDSSLRSPQDSSFPRPQDSSLRSTQDSSFRSPQDSSFRSPQNLSFRSEAEESASRAETALTLAALTSTFEAALRLLSPFMPFLTEEIWHALYAGEPPAKSIALTRYPQPGDFPASTLSVAAMETMQELITSVRALRKDLGVPEKEATPITLYAGARVLALTGAHADMLGRLARVSAIEFSTEPLTGNNARSTPSFDLAVVYERAIDVAAERERHTKDLAKFAKQIDANEARLNDEKFTAKAPPHIVEGLRKQTAELRILRDKTKAALDALPPG